MKAVWYDRVGPAAEVLTFGELPTPEAAAGEVRIRLEASGVNPADTYRRAGTYHGQRFPRVIPNSDGAGVIDQVEARHLLNDGQSGASAGQGGAQANPTQQKPVYVSRPQRATRARNASSF